VTTINLCTHNEQVEAFGKKERKKERKKRERKKK
jgi:hypothetical protein